MKHSFEVGQKVWRNAVINGYAEIQVGIIVKKRRVTLEELKDDIIEEHKPDVWYNVSVNGVELDKAINPYEWFVSKEELIKHLFAGKE